jgi:hypothetical protein
MKQPQSIRPEDGSVLITSLMTTTILSIICATTLYVASQNFNTVSQAVAWHQSLNAAESGVSQAIAALNDGAWTSWTVYSGSAPNVAPSGSPAPGATSAPDTAHFNLLRTASIPVQTTSYGVSNLITTTGETSALSNWVTVDTGGMGLDQNGNQWYRIRSTGSATAPGLRRVSGYRTDSSLRKISLVFDRKTGIALGNSTPFASRTIEVIAQPLSSSDWSRGITVLNWISMSGSGMIDSFDSSNPFKSNNGLYDPTKHQNHGDVGTKNSTNSDLRNTYVWGNVAYSGPAIKNTTNVEGTISTPFNPSVPPTSDPIWTSGSYTSYSGGGNPPATTPAYTFTATGTKSSPTLIKINGDFTVPGGKSFAIASSGTSKYISIWVTGKFTTSGSGYVTQDPNVHVTWIVDNDITVSGDSYNNQSGRAGNASFIGVGSNHKVTDSGSANFIGTINTPSFDVTVSGSGQFCGALIGNTLTISGGAGLHYDEALGSSGDSTLVGNYAYSSWFEDTR